jgi:LysM repeat protein
MKSTEKPKLKTSPKIGSKIFTKKTNSNKKKSSQTQDSDKKPDTSLLKKNEFALILLGALLLTIIIFFFFFRTSDSNPTTVKQNISKTSLVDFEKRMQNIEKILQIEQGSKAGSIKIKQNITQDNHINDRLSRLETAFSVKFDSLIDRMGEIEKNISLLKNKPAVTKSVQSKPKISIPVKKAVKKKSIFHTVQKKETLYSISKKYNTSITALRKLNKLSKNATIYPGDNIIVR